MAQSLHEVAVPNGTLHYVARGHGETVVFIHGAQEDYRVFLPQVELLSSDFNVVSYSRRYNFPNDNERGGAYNAKTEAEDLKILVDTLGTPVHMVGHSYGGVIALEFAMSHPEWTKSLVLSEPALVDWLRQIPDCPTSYRDVREHLIRDTREAFGTGDTSSVMKELFEFFAGADIRDRVPPGVLTMLTDNLREMEALVYSDDGFEAPFPEALHHLDMPVLIVTAGRTMPLLQCTNKKLLETLPGAEHYHLNEAGHELWSTHPEDLSGAVSDFLNH